VSARDVQKIEHILAVLNRATKPDDMGLPGFSLHPLKGRFKGFWSVTVRDNRRVIFKIKNGVSPEMAIRLSKAFGSSPEVWLGLQLDYDLAQAKKNSKQIKVKKAVPA